MPNDAARSFLNDHAELLGGVDPGDLRALPARKIGRLHYVRFQQTIAGIPVRGAHVVVRLNESDRAAAGANHVRRLRAAGEWRLDRAAAVARAASVVEPVAEPAAEQIYFARNGDALPAWRVVVKSVRPPGQWELVISAADGSLLERQNLRHGGSSGYAYPRNPVTGGVEQVALDVPDASSALKNDQTVVYTYLPALQGKVAPYTLSQLATRQNGNFFYQAGDARFSEVQLYYGMQRVNALFQNLGFPGWDTPLAGVVLFQDYDEKQGKFIGSDNAYFTADDLTPNGGLFFYLTGRNGDMSLDSDVIFHEYTHAIVNWAVGSEQSMRFQAINEGTADYFSDSFMNDPNEAEYAAQLFGLRTPYLRRAANRNTWPYNTVGEGHVDGNIWSGALWDVRTALGQEAADNIAINAVASLTPDADFFDAASAAVDAAEELYGDRAAIIVDAIMTNRGVYTDDAETAAESVDLSGNQKARGHISAASAGRLRLGAQQYRIQVPEGSKKLTVRVDAASDVRFYLRYRVPVTIEDGSLVAEQVSTTGPSVAGSLTLDNTPELQAGIYYIAVVNTTGNAVDYTIQASADGSGKTLVTMLANGETGRGSAPAGPFLASRQFAVDVPDGVTALRVALDADQNVGLYVRYNGPVYITDAGFPTADVIADVDSRSQRMTVALRSGDPLPAGRYFIGVYNEGDQTVGYAVTAMFDVRAAR